MERTLTEARRLFNQGVQGGEGTRDVLPMAQVLAEKALRLEPREAMGFAERAVALMPPRLTARARGARGVAVVDH